MVNKPLRFVPARLKERENIAKVLRELLEQAERGEITTLVVATYKHVEPEPGEKPSYLLHTNVVTCDNDIVVGGIVGKLRQYIESL